MIQNDEKQYNIVIIFVQKENWTLVKRAIITC